MARNDREALTLLTSTMTMGGTMTCSRPFLACVNEVCPFSHLRGWVTVNWFLTNPHWQDTRMLQGHDDTGDVVSQAHLNHL